MRTQEFIQKLKALAAEQGVEIRLHENEGKGGHFTLQYGDKKILLASSSGDMGLKTFHKNLRGLGISEQDFNQNFKPQLSDKTMLLNARENTYLCMTSKNESVQQLAKAIGRSGNTVQNFLTGKYQLPDIHLIYNISGYYGYSMETWVSTPAKDILNKQKITTPFNVKSFSEVGKIFSKHLIKRMEVMGIDIGFITKRIGSKLSLNDIGNIHFTAARKAINLLGFTMDEFIGSDILSKPDATLSQKSFKKATRRMLVALSMLANSLINQPATAKVDISNKTTTSNSPTQANVIPFSKPAVTMNPHPEAANISLPHGVNLRRNMVAMMSKEMNIAKIVRITNLPEAEIKGIFFGAIQNPNAYTSYRIAHAFKHELETFLKTPSRLISQLDPTIPKNQAPLSENQFRHGLKENLHIHSKEKNISISREYRKLGKVDLTITQLDNVSRKLKTTIKDITTIHPALTAKQEDAIALKQRGRISHNIKDIENSIVKRSTVSMVKTFSNTITSSAKTVLHGSVIATKVGISIAKGVAGAIGTASPYILVEMMARIVADDLEQKQSTLMKSKNPLATPVKALNVLSTSTKQIVLNVGLLPANILNGAIEQPFARAINLSRHKNLTPIGRATISTLNTISLPYHVIAGARQGILNSWSSYQRHAKTWNAAAGALLSQAVNAFSAGMDNYLNAAHWAMGGRSDTSYFATREFSSALKSTGLSDNYSFVQGLDLARGWESFANYKNCNLSHFFGGNFSHFIGGVASPVGHIEGLKNSALEVMYKDHLICMPASDGKILFSDAELQQMLAELEEAIGVHKAYPFISLERNSFGFFYPVLHPFYQKTLVGEVISLLDYFMKGFLNGDIFSAEFIKNWADHPDRDNAYLKSKLLDLKKLYKNDQQSYASLREKLCRAGLELPSQLTFNDKFVSTFRIIAKQNSIRHYQNMFFVDPDFTVEYTIGETARYKAYQQQHLNETGRLPDDHVKLRNLFEEECKAIKEKMPKLALFRKYFQMLGLINFLCYYLTTLKSMGKSIALHNVPKNHSSTFPNVLPPIPARYYHTRPMTITLGELVKCLSALELSELTQWLDHSMVRSKKRFFSAT